MPDTYCSDPWVLALCARMRAAREATNVNGATSARVMGMTPTRLSYLENGRTEPRAKDVALYARLTGVDVADLLYGDDPAERAPLEVPDTEAARRVSPGSAGRARSLQKRRESGKKRPMSPNRAVPVPEPTGPTWVPAAWRKPTDEEAAS